MTGLEYERLVAKYLRRHSYFGVSVTRGSGDFGVDVIAHKGSHKYAVQCKYYTSAVSLDAVQEAVAGMAYYNCDRAMVVTNSTYTNAAKELAKHNNVELLENITSAGPSPLLAKIAVIFIPLLFVLAAFAGMCAAAGETIIKQIQAGNYGMAAYNIFSLLGIALIIGAVVYFIRRKRKSPPKNGEHKEG